PELDTLARQPSAQLTPHGANPASPPSSETRESTAAQDRPTNRGPLSGVVDPSSAWLHSPARKRYYIGGSRPHRHGRVLGVRLGGHSRDQPTLGLGVSDGFRGSNGDRARQPRAGRKDDAGYPVGVSTPTHVAREALTL